MTRDFVGRVVIITGAWRGIGRAAAARFHKRGASVAVNVRDPERAALADSLGPRALAVPGDVAAPGVPEDLVRRTSSLRPARHPRQQRRLCALHALPAT